MKKISSLKCWKLRGYLLKNADKREILEAIEQVSRIKFLLPAYISQTGHHDCQKQV
jgi:DNA-binding NarL/FixJ family response regulator